jgi:aspartyl-tRNA synthetase
MTRKETDGLTVEIQGVGAGGLPLCKVADEGGKVVLQTGNRQVSSPATPRASSFQRMQPSPAISSSFFSAGRSGVSRKYLNWLRTTLADRRKLIPPNQWEFLFIVDMPAFEWSEETRSGSSSTTRSPCRTTRTSRFSKAIQARCGQMLTTSCSTA